jgi:hypothetical protein
MGLSGKALAQTGGGKPFKNVKYQTFQPGEYFRWEKSMLEERFEQARNPHREQQRGPFRGGPSAITEDDIINYNKAWNPYDPLFNDKEYARKAGYPGVPAFVNFQSPRGNPPSAIPMDTGDKWYYHNDGSDLRVWTHIFAGDSFTSEPEASEFTELTVPGSDLRMFVLGSSANMYNAKGDHVGWCYTNTREGYKKIIDGSPPPTFTENMSEWAEYFPAGHYTTDEEYEYIKELWDREYIRGSQKLYWEDVNIGDEPIWTCDGPIGYQDLNTLHGGGGRTSIRGSNQNLDTMFRDKYGIYLGIAAMHHGSRNIPNARSLFYNHTAALFMARMVTNFIGDAGLVTRIRWRFPSMFNEMQWEPFHGGDILNKVPYMKGKMATVHASEGDTIIAKGYVTDKYINDRGEHTIDISSWAETLDERIIEVVDFSAKLPSKKG